MEDITAPARDEGLAPPPKTSQPRKRRFGAVAFGLVTALALGLAGGANMHRLVDLDQTATWFQQIESALQSSFTLARREIASRFESLTSGPTTGAQARERPNSDGMIEQAVNDFSRRVDQVRAANEGSARDLGQEIEHIRSSAEQNQRELVAKLAHLGERLERIERRSAAPAPVAAQPVVKPTPASPAKPVRQPAPAAKAKGAPKQTSTETKPGIDVKGIANWTVLDVFDGTAALEGPRGLVEVTVGDNLPELGRVQAITRAGGRWVVATTKGVITPD